MIVTIVILFIVSGLFFLQRIKIIRLREDLDSCHDLIHKLQCDTTFLSENLVARLEALEKANPENKKRRTMWDTFPKDSNGKPIINYPTVSE